MPWWGWVLVGAILLGSEIVIDAEFYFVFLGLAALLVGGAGLAGLEGPIWAEWLAFAALSGVSIVVFRSQLYDRFVSARGVDSGPVGEVATASEPIDPGERGQVELRGTVWTAENVGNVRVDAGSAAVVEGVEGVTLLVVDELADA